MCENNMLTNIFTYNSVLIGSCINTLWYIDEIGIRMEI